MNTRPIVIAGASVVGAACAAVSSVALYDLAAACGIPEPLSAGLPIALDVGAGVGALVWITEKGEARTWGRAVAISALGLSLAGNGATHALSLALIEVGLPLVLAVGACIPAMLWAVIHMAALMVKPVAAKSTSAKTPKTRARRDQSPSPASNEAPAEPAPAPISELAAAGTKRDRARAYATKYPNASGSEIAKAAECSPTEAWKAQKWVKTQKEMSA